MSTYRHDADTTTTGRAGASDALGFGITCADALIDGLRASGTEVDVVGASEPQQTAWTAAMLQRVEHAATSRSYDVVLAFHAFWPFTADLRRILDDTAPCPLVTYTHGSHWDPTDLFRTERYPHLRWADLGNLLAADRVLAVSRYMRDTILHNIRAVSQVAADELERRMRVVGLPLNLPLIDACARPPAADRWTIVFNHAPVAAKQPGVFLDVAAQVLATTQAHILVTRHFPTGSPWATRLHTLAGAYPGRLVLGDDLPTRDYYQALWASHMQVSTATHESLGVATLEAMVTGNHCLLPRTGAYPDIAAGDPAVLYDDIADLVARLAAGPQPEVVQRHDTRIRATYSPTAVAACVHGVLAEVLDTSPGAPPRSP